MSPLSSRKIRFIFLLVLSGVLTACDGSPTTSSGSASEASADNVYCADNTPIASSAQGNVYGFDVPDGHCLGISDDNSPRKTVPLTVHSFRIDEDIPVDTNFSIESSVRIYLHTEGLNLGGYNLNVAVDITNNSTYPYCYDIGDIVFLDADDVVLIDDADRSPGAGGARYQWLSFYRKHYCLSPGSTFTHIAEAFFVSIDTFNSIETASIASIVLDDDLSSGYSLVETLTTSSMDWIYPGLGSLSYPTLSVSWTNTTSSRMELDDNSQVVWFFDDDGYAVSSARVYLEDGLGIDEDDLTDDDYVIEVGESFTLNDTYADNAAVTPSSATSARVYLDWFPVSD